MQRVMRMPMPNHWFLGLELVYTILIVLFCLLVFLKTREIYNLTKHKGILFFRYAFVFFGLAYAFRLLLFIFMFSSETLNYNLRFIRSLMPVSNLVVAFLSTMAILYLAYSTVWKKIEVEHFLTFSTIIALAIAVVSFMFRSPFILSIIQLVLIIGATVVIFKNHKHAKKKFGTKALYILIFLFWIFSLLVLNSRNLIAFEVKVVLLVLSIAVFIAIYLKVSKWLK
jgi:hypothetical protein